MRIADIAPIALLPLNIPELLPLHNEQGSMIGFGGSAASSTSVERLQRGHQRVIDSPRYVIIEEKLQKYYRTYVAYVEAISIHDLIFHSKNLTKVLETCHIRKKDGNK